VGGVSILGQGFLGLGRFWMTLLQVTPPVVSPHWSAIKGMKLKLALRGLEELFSSCAVVSVFGSGGK
jgi:hypothetical protein